MRTSKELQVGKAGEYLVCSELIMKGFVAFPSEQGLPYDVVVDTGKKLLRCQVKTTFAPRIVPQRATQIPCYIFNVKRNGKNGKGRYNAEEIDFFALVDLSTKQIGYLKTDLMPDTLNIRVDSFRGSYYDEKGVANTLLVKELASNNFTTKQISEKTGLDISAINKMKKPEYQPFVSGARYLSDFFREKKWFESL